MSISDESSGLQRIKKGAADSRAAACKAGIWLPRGRATNLPTLVESCGRSSREIFERGVGFERGAVEEFDDVGPVGISMRGPEPRTFEVSEREQYGS